MSVSSCAEALRIIGHDLDWRGIRTFFVRRDENIFVVEGGYQSPPAITPVTLHYALSDIERLEREAKERNDHLSPVKDFLSLAEILWAVAVSVSNKQSRLLSVSNTPSTETMPILKIEYETAQGDRVIDDLTGAAIYDLGISIYKLRGTSSINGSRYRRFSALNDSNQPRHWTATVLQWLVIVPRRTVVTVIDNGKIGMKTVGRTRVDTLAALWSIGRFQESFFLPGWYSQFSNTSELFNYCPAIAANNPASILSHRSLKLFWRAVNYGNPKTAGAKGISAGAIGARLLPLFHLDYDAVLCRSRYEKTLPQLPFFNFPVL
jgi:hypothetical protein